MIETNLIPFGLRVKDGVFVDVFDVPRGKHCGCICPSCKTPLIARQGDIKEWHFAHDTRSTYARTEKVCKFSFYVSVRMMARQVISEKIELVLPRYEDAISEIHKSSGRRVSIPFVVANQQRILLTQVEIEKTFAGVPVDIVGKVKSYRFVIFFSHPSRNVPRSLYSPGDQKCGIIGISLEPLARLFSTSKGKEKSYKDILQEYLTNHIESKTWLYHPRYASCENEAKQEFEKRISQLERKTAQNTDSKIEHDEKEIYPLKNDDPLWKIALERTKEEFRNKKYLDPELPGWAGLVKSEAMELFKRLKNK